MKEYSSFLFDKFDKNINRIVFLICTPFTFIHKTAPEKSGAVLINHLLSEPSFFSLARSTTKSSRWAFFFLTCRALRITIFCICFISYFSKYVKKKFSCSNMLQYEIFLPSPVRLFSFHIINMPNFSQVRLFLRIFLHLFFRSPKTKKGRALTLPYTK